MFTASPGFFATLSGSSIVAPSTVLNLTNWDIALPFNSSQEFFCDFFTGTCGSQVSNPSPSTSRSTCLTVSAPLTGTVYPSYFYAQGGLVYFRVPCWGSTTSTNTKSPRAELRSRVTGTGSTQSGDFIGNNLPLLRIKGGVFRVPDSGSRRTHIMQFHADTTAAPPAPSPVSSGDVFMILSFNNSGNLISTVTTVDQSTNTPKTLCGSHVFPFATTAVPNVYDVQADLQMGSNQIAWTITDLTTGQTFNDTQAIDSGWATVNMYAKAGAYSSEQMLCSTDGPTATGQGYLLYPAQVTDYFQSCLSFLSLTLQSP